MPGRSRRAMRGLILAPSTATVERDTARSLRSHCGWSAQLSWRSPPRFSRWRRCLPLEASTGLVPASAANDASLVLRLGSPLDTAVERRRPVRRRAPRADRAPARPSRRLGESRHGESSQALAHVVGGGDEERAQLVEGGGARLHGAATLEQEQTQILAPTTAARRRSRSAVSARNVRLLIVPRGTPTQAAISRCVSPPKFPLPLGAEQDARALGRVGGRGGRGMGRHRELAGEGRPGTRGAASGPGRTSRSSERNGATGTASLALASRVRLDRAAPAQPDGAEWRYGLLWQGPVSVATNVGGASETSCAVIFPVQWKSAKSPVPPAVTNSPVAAPVERSAWPL